MASYCSGCGISIGEGARFCSACGKPVIDPAVFPAQARPLTRPVAGRKLAGVCQGLANHYGWDVTVTRVIAVLLAVVLFPVGLVAYAAFWVLMPQEPQFLPPVTGMNAST